MPRLPLREHLRAVYGEALYRCGPVRRARAALAGKGLVLMYHRVLRKRDIPRDLHPGMYVTSDDFERHARYLAAHHQVLTLEEFAEWLEGTRQCDRVPCAITFDDGWEDNYTEAFPILQRYRLPATIFLITDAVGTPGMLTWRQVQEMEAAGVTFGSHTASHPVLTAVDEERIRQELTKPIPCLRQQLRKPSGWFCYPKGAYDERSLRIAKELYAAAVSVDEGPVARNDDRHRLRRIGIHHDVTRTTGLFACRLVSLV